MTLRQRIINTVFGNAIEAEISRRVSLATRALDDATDRAIRPGTHPRDRYDYDRDEVLADALQAWRVNPLARRIVALTSQYVVGGGLQIESDHPATHKFLQQWWNHPLNHIQIRAFEWCDELTRAGNLFPLLSTDASGMSYVRAIPAADIDEIITRPNDIEQPLQFKPKPTNADLDPSPWPAYNAQRDAPAKNGLLPAVMLHYAINRPVGAKWGEPDLAPILRWLARYAVWLEDRVRLNRFRQAFLYVVKGQFASAAERLARQGELNADPPNPGSILVTDPTEEWGVIHPKLDSFEAGEDGLAIKKMLAAGSGTPLHFIAEPESSTRTTAVQAGGPTYRHYEQRQLFFTFALTDLARAVTHRRAHYDSRIDPDADIRVIGGDISPRDNAALAVAASTITGMLLDLRRAQAIDNAEMLRLAYKFAGEFVDVDDMLARGAAADPLPTTTTKTDEATSGRPGDAISVDTKTGQVDVLARKNGQPQETII